jgi:hypothetical protein
LLGAASTLMLLTFISANDETKAIADKKIAVVLIMFNIFVWTFLLLLFVIATSSVYIFNNIPPIDIQILSNLYPDP